MAEIYGPNLDAWIEFPVLPDPWEEWWGFAMYARVQANGDNLRWDMHANSATPGDAAISGLGSTTLSWGQSTITLEAGDALGFRLNGDVISFWHREEGVWSEIFSGTPSDPGFDDYPGLLNAGYVAIDFGGPNNPGSFTTPELDNFRIAEWTGSPPPAFPATTTASDDFSAANGTYITDTGNWETWHHHNGGGCSSSSTTGSLQTNGGRLVNAEYTYPCGMWVYYFLGFSDTPTVPPSPVLLSSAPCCATNGPAQSATGPILPVITPTWTPECTGGGDVPSASDLTDAEDWDQ